MIVQPIGHYASHRPLGQIALILLYKAANNSMYLIELSTYLFSVATFFVFIKSLDEKRIFTLVSVIIGGVVFVGMGYIFHLHGLYYSITLLYLSVLFYFYRKTPSMRNLAITSSATLITAFCHPFSIIFHIFYLIGRSIESRNHIPKKLFFTGAGIIFFEIILLKVIVTSSEINLDIQYIIELKRIYNELEVNKIITLFLVILALLPIIGLNLKRRYKIYLTLVALLTAAVCYYLSLPILIVVVFTCALKLIYLKRWTILFLLLATFFFTIFSAILSDHLRLFVLFVIAYAISVDWQFFEDKIAFSKPALKYISYAVFISTVIVVVLLRNDVQIPVLSKISNQLFAKKESTYQLEKVIDWYLHSKYKDDKLLLFDESLPDTIIDCNGDNGLCPTTNNSLNIYLHSMNKERKIDNRNNSQLYVLFNNCGEDDTRVVYSLNGKYSVNVSVLLVNY